ncbi:MAG: signal recognition particle-docking protein FtsY [Desulfarculus sp.]|nr:signal recognition particle-docking protein FtsY [Desulfarculus sp.]
MGLLNFWKKKDKPPQEEAPPPASSQEAPEQPPAPQPAAAPQEAPLAGTPSEAPGELVAETAPSQPQELILPAPEAPPETSPEAAPPPEPEKKKGFLARLAERLGKTREKISGSIDRLTLGRKIDEELLDELEEVLVTADLGVKTSLELIEGLRGQVRRQELSDAEALKAALRAGMERVLTSVAPVPSRHNAPHVIMVVGVNGVGKTTTIGKLANYFGQQGRKVLLGASDTFRAAAAEQLEIWAERVGCPIVRQKHGADPSAVAYDAVEAAQNRGRDLVIIDTAGRLHTKVNLMEELKKIHRVLNKRLEGAPHEVLLVLDATTGQNALSQAKLFHEAVPLTGLVLTKLDGTAKGGVVVAIAEAMRLPICFVGVGEGLEDLRPFDPQEFAAAIF